MATRPAAVDNAATPRIFAQRPSPSFIDAFRAHIARTGEPETFADLHHGPIRRDEPFHKLANVKVPQEKRPNSDMAPCPMCQPNKFLDGWLVHFMDLRVVGFIGHCCASKDTRAEADREWEERQKRDREEGYLLPVLPRLSGWLDTLGSVREPVEEARRIFRAFRSDGATFYRALRTVRANGGRLIVTEVMHGASGDGPSGMRTRGSTYQTRDVDFGTLAGLTAVHSDYNPVKALDEMIARVAPHVQADEEAALNYIVNGGPVRRSAAYAALKKTVREFGALIAALDDFRAFFALANLSRITQWASHVDAPVAFAARLGQPNPEGERSLIFDAKGDYFSLKIKPSLWRPTAQLSLSEPDDDARG